MGNIEIAVIVLGLIGFVFAIFLAYLSKKLKVEEDPKAGKVLAILPGLNCGACGFNGCRAYAEAVVKECDIFAGCLPGGKGINDQVSDVLGIVGCLSNAKQILVCRCQADANQKNQSSDYSGPQNCRAADMVRSAIDCTYGCLALGDCLKVCPTGALSLENKRIQINTKKCISCGKCILACPRNLFEFIALDTFKKIYYVGCSNTESALEVRKVCKRGCIACGICARVENSPYNIKNNLSIVDYKKLGQTKPLQEGKDKCPTKCIFDLDA